MSTPTKPITYEDSLTMPENRFEEIVHGESRIMPPPTKRHASLLRKLVKILERQLDETVYEVLCQGSGLGIQRNPLTYRIPDVMVYRTEVLRRDRLSTAQNDPYIWATPELIVECLSPSNRKGPIRDLVAGYARIAVPEVWLLDPQLRRFTSYRYAAGALQESPATIRLPLDDLWTAFFN